MRRGKSLTWRPLILLLVSAPLIVILAILTRHFDRAQQAPEAAARPTATSAPATVPPLTPSSTAAAVQSRQARLAPPQQVAAAPDSQPDLQSVFASAAKEFGVPEGILLAVSYNESRWEHHHGEPSTDGGYGLMHLTDLPDTNQEGTRHADPRQHTLLAAARMLGTIPDVLKRDPAQNVRGGAALLAQYARDTVGTTPRDTADWYGAVAMYRGASDVGVSLEFADAVFTTLRRGQTAVTSDGQAITLAPEDVTPNRRTADQLVQHASDHAAVECPSDVTCTFVPAVYQVNDSKNPADYGDYDLATRPERGLTISYIVIHDTEATFTDAIKTFQNPKENLSANYVIRSDDGQVVQMVRNHDVAHHAGNWYINTHSIGVEHEGFAVEGATWFSEPLYQASARLVRYLAEKYNVPLDRAHIIGHDNVPGLTPEDQKRQHWDPGPFWDWAHYMDLLGAPLKPGADSRIVTIAPRFATNTPTVSSRCDANGCADLPPQAANFVYLRQAPSPNAPLIADAALTALQTSPGQGTTRADDWGDKAVTGQRFYLAESRGDWDAIWFGGQKAWFYNPGHASTLPSQGTLVTPRKGKAAIPVYGEAYPEASAYPPNVTPVPIVPLQYSIPAGQIYVATGLVPTDYYDAMTYATDPSGYAVVKGQTKYYQIFFNHRLAFVRADDVETLSGQ